uniref:Uncharacterized protein n=1 Tax=Arundo donax TaxID=35708 RepID=A0A0A9CZ43_ARUDO
MLSSGCYQGSKFALKTQLASSMLSFKKGWCPVVYFDTYSFNTYLFFLISSFS